MGVKKPGLDYFSLDVALDDKWELIEAEYGTRGFAVVVKLLQKIYGGQGYYCEWNDEVALMFTRRYCPSVGVKVVSEIVAAAIRRGIFDENLFKKYNILTSHGIQARYLEATKRRNQAEIKNEYLLVQFAPKNENVYISGQNVNISDQNVYISSQSKVKESKVKESKVKESKVKESKVDHSVALAAYCQNINATPSYMEVERLTAFNVDDDLIIEAINIAVGNNAKKIVYIEAILRNCVDSGITTLEAFKNAKKINKAKSKTAKGKGKEQVSYTDEKMRELELKLLRKG